MATKRQPASRSGQNAPSAKKPRNEALFLEIQQEWNKAEEAIKRSEQVSLEVSIPAISELRYAGRRIVDAFNLAASEGDDADRVLALLEDARFCCHRAQHDAIDAAMAKIAIDLDDLTSRLGFDPVIKACPGFQEFYAQFARTRAKIAASRGKREDRNAIYDAVTETDLPAIIKSYETVMAVRPVAKKFAWQMRMGGLNAILLTLVAIAGMIFAALAVPWDKWVGEPQVSVSPAPSRSPPAAEV